MGLGLLNEKELQSLASKKEDYNLIGPLQGELGVSIYYYTITFRYEMDFYTPSCPLYPRLGALNYWPEYFVIA